MTALRLYKRYSLSIVGIFVLAVTLAASVRKSAIAQTVPTSTSPAVVPANPSIPTDPTENPTPQSVAPTSTDDVQTEEALPQPAPLVLPGESEIPTANYSDANMSVDYPSTWQVAVDADNMVSIQNDAEAPQAITQVFRVAAPPGPLVDANIDSFVEEGATVRRYSSVTIDDQDALVIWLSDRPDELSSAIATFIGYGSETVFLFSRYSPDADSPDADSPDADSEQTVTVDPDLEGNFEDSLLRLHSSFQNLAAVSNTTEDVMPTDLEE